MQRIASKLASENHMKDFSLANQHVSVSDAKRNYLILRNSYIQIAKQAESEYEELFQSKYIDMKHFIEEGLSDGYQLIFEKIAIASEQLVNMGDYTSTPENFFNDYFLDKTRWEEKFGLVFDEYMSIELEAENLKRYRQARKDSRGRIIGGGFGIEGAAKGMAIAGATNLVTGAFHGIFNTISNTISDAKKTKKIEALFQDSSTLKTLTSAIYDDIEAIHITLHEILLNKGLVEVDGFITEKDSRSADAIVQNVKNGRITGERARLEALSQAISLDPSDLRSYELLMSEKLCPQQEIESLAQHLQVDLNSTKCKILLSHYADVSDNNSEDVIAGTIEEIHNHAKELCCSNYESVIWIGQQRLDELDTLARTFDGFEYATRDDKAQAVAEKAALAGELTKVGLAGFAEPDVCLTNELFDTPLDETKIDALKSKIAGNDYKYQRAGEIANKLQQVVNQLDCIARTFENITYQTKYDAYNAASEKAVIIEKLENAGLSIKTLNSTSLDGIGIVDDESLQEISKNLKESELTYKGTKELARKIDSIIKTIRTHEKHTYETQAEAKQAEADKRQLDSIMVDVDFKNEVSINNTLTKLVNANHVYIGTKKQIDELKLALTTIEREQRTVYRREYSSLEEANIARKNLDAIVAQVDPIAKLFQSIKEQSFFVKGSIPKDKLSAFIVKVKRIYDISLNENDVFAYIDETLFGGGDIGICLTHSDLIVTKDKLGVFKLTDIVDFELVGFVNKAIEFTDAEKGQFKYTGTQGNQGIQDFYKILGQFWLTHQEGEVEQSVTKAHGNTSSDEKESIARGIVSNFKSDKNQKFFIKPAIPQDKLKAFCLNARSKFGSAVTECEILAYFDETLFGAGDNGVAVTDTHLIVTVDDCGVFELNKIRDVSISGMLNRKISFTNIGSQQRYNFILTQGNKGAKNIADILALLSSS